MSYLKRFCIFVGSAIASTWIYNILVRLIRNPLLMVLILLIMGLSFNQGRMYYNDFMVEYKRLNSEKQEEEDDTSDNLKFTKLDEFLYSLTGSVGEGDCDRIVADMPSDFTLILESPGGNLAEGSCLAAHIKLRNVVTVVRYTKVLNAEGKVVYTPGIVS